MTAPVFQAIGSVASNNGGAGIVVSWPAHQTDDVGFLFLKGSPGAPGVLSSGWTLIAQVANSTTGDAAFRLSVYWKRAASSSEGATSVADSGNYNAGIIAVVRGARPLVDPIQGSLTGAQTISGLGTITVATGTPFVVNANENLVLIHSGSQDGPFTKNGNDAYTLAAAAASWTQQYELFTNFAVGSAVPSSTDYVNSVAVRSSQSGSGTGSLAGIAFGVHPAVVSSAFSSSGSATVSNPGAKILSSSFSSSGSATVSNPGNVNRESSFSSAGVATVGNPGNALFRSAFSSAGVATVSNPGAQISASSFASAGAGAAVMVSGGLVASSFNSQSSSAGNMIGASTAESSFASDGLSFAAMFSPNTASSSFSASGSSQARMYSPTLTITTLQDGSGGDPDSGATIDWTICDFVNVNLTSGTGSFPIDHVNLIAGKKISVHVHNDVTATGTILWNGGDAPVTWIGMAAPPDMPANGETLHVEFECNADRTEIFGRLFVDEDVREILDGLDRRYGRTLFDHSTNVGNVSTTETALYSDIIIGGTLAQDGDKILAEYAVEFATSINAKEIMVYFPTSVVVFDTGALAITAATGCDLRVLIIRKTASTARAVVTITTLPVAVGGGNAQITDEATLTGINFDQDNVLRLSAIGGASNDVIAKLAFGEFKPAAV